MACDDDLWRPKKNLLIRLQGGDREDPALTRDSTPPLQPQIPAPRWPPLQPLYSGLQPYGSTNFRTDPQKDCQQSGLSLLGSCANHQYTMEAMERTPTPPSQTAAQIRERIAQVESDLERLKEELVQIDTDEKRRKRENHDVDVVGTITTTAVEADHGRARPGDWKWPLSAQEYDRYGRQLVLPNVGIHGVFLRRAPHPKGGRGLRMNSHD